MSAYNPQEFIDAINSKLESTKGVPSCPFCGSRDYTSTDSLATILISKDKTNINLGPTIPSGMIICKKCGHIDFFALGVLGLINREGKQKNGGQTEEKAK